MIKQLIFTLFFLFPLFLIGQTVLVEGYVFETGNRGYLGQADVTILDNTSKAVIGESFTDKAGVFKMGLPPGNEYLIRVEKKPFKTMEQVVSTAGKSDGEKVYVKYEMKRMPGYNFEVTLAPARSDEDIVVDAITGAKIEVYNNTTEKELMTIEKSKSHVFNVRFEQGNHYTILIRKDKFFNKRLEAYVNVKGCILCFDGVGDVKPGVADVLTEGLEMGTLLANVELQPIEMNKGIELKNIYYDYNSARIKTAAKKELDKLVDLLKDNNSLLVELGSHTDSRGNDKYNQRLSQKRAQSVVNYLAKKGIQKQNLLAKGYGESKLVNSCGNGIECSEKKHQKNRRTELKVVGYVNESMIDNRSLIEIKEAEKFDRMLAELEGSEVKVKEGEDLPDEISKQLDKKAKTEITKPLDKNTQKPSGKKVQKPVLSKPTVVKPDTDNPKVKEKKKIIVHNPMPEKRERITAPVEKVQPKVKVDEPIQNIENVDEISEDFEESTIPTKVVSDLDVTSVRQLKKPQKLSRTYTGYKVEFLSSMTELPVSHEIFSRHGNIVVEENKEGNYAYLLGDFESAVDADHFLTNILIKRYPGARVVRYVKGRRVVR